MLNHFVLFSGGAEAKRAEKPVSATVLFGGDSIVEVERVTERIVAEGAVLLVVVASEAANERVPPPAPPPPPVLAVRRRPQILPPRRGEAMNAEGHAASLGERDLRVVVDGVGGRRR